MNLFRSLVSYLAKPTISLELVKAERKLAELRKTYAAGNFSGHPEEMLEDIEDAQWVVKRLSEKSANK